VHSLSNNKEAFCLFIDYFLSRIGGVEG